MIKKMLMLSLMFLQSQLSEGGAAPQLDCAIRLESGKELRYLLALPEGYEDSEEAFPLLLFLHGGGESGHDLEKVKKNGPPRLIEEGVQLPYIVVSPQNDGTKAFWDESLLVRLLDALEQELRVDADRVYLAGLSRGAYGAWRLAMGNPDRFAALLAVSGGAPPPYAAWLKDMPIWAFHGERDTVVPPEETIRIVEALKRVGGNVKLTLYPEAKHDAWTQTFANPEVFEWLSAQTLENRKMVFPGENWKSASLESHGMDDPAFIGALEVLKSFSGDDGLRQTIVIKNGRTVFEGEAIEKAHNIYSCSKSFTSTVLGILIQEGACELDSVAAEFEPTLKERYPQATLRHFASMTSGYSAEGDSRWGEKSEDWSATPYAVADPHFAPGSAYAYWDEAMMMLGKVLTQAASEDLKAIFDRRIAKPIGMGEWDWWSETESAAGIPIRNGCTGISLSASQLARVGHLFLNDGRWKGKQLIPETWVKQATGVQVPVDLPIGETDRSAVLGNGRYGFNWWIRGDLGDMPDAPASVFYMSGLHNNMCFIVPEWDMVIVRMGEDGNPAEGKRQAYNRFFAALSEAMN